MVLTGGCHCGAVRYEAEGAALTHALCHCNDCRRSAGAPMVGWTMYRLDAVKVTRGAPKVYASSELAEGTFALIVVLASEAVPARAPIQVAERIGWMEHAHELPAFERYLPRK